MTEREALTDLLEAVDLAIYSGDWKVDGACDPDAAIQRARNVLAQTQNCQCPECKVLLHASDCAVHSEPAYPKGECNCGAQPEQEPVAMKFKIYKPTVPDPVRQGINNALLPWVYDQDRSSGFDASMWVTPVATLPPQRKPLTDEEIRDALEAEFLHSDGKRNWHDDVRVARAIEAAHGIKGEA